MKDRNDQAIDLRSWRQFVAVAEHLHFGRAAAQLAMTQPPLTLGIQQLERRLGVSLFERSRRSVRLSPAGAALIEPVRQLLRQAALLPALALAASQGEIGQLTLGFISTIAFGPLPRWLRDFRVVNPQVAVRLQEATSDVQLLALAQGEIDAGFLLHAPGVGPASPEQRLSVGVEPMLLALPEASPLAVARSFVLADVLAQGLVVFPRGIAPSLYDALLAYYHGHGVAPAIAQEAIQMQTIVNLVSAGLGIAWVPRTMTQLQRAGVVYRALPEPYARAAPHCETSLVWPAGAAPAVLRFVDHVRDALTRPATVAAAAAAR